MPQLFSPAADTVLRTMLGAAALFALSFPFVAYGFYRSPGITKVGIAIEQPVPFSHKHHVAECGIDCRYCHATVETGAFAGMPSTSVCMGCHSQLWSKAAVLEPVRQSWASGVPLSWNRVNNLPGFVYFRHDIHVSKGIGCTSCHGNVATMPLMQKGQPLTMQWCLQCHRGPQQFIRPRAEVFNPWYEGPPHPELVQQYGIETSHLQNCYTCHR